jgi:hypothetical protein
LPQQYRYYTARATTGIIKIGAGTLKNTTTTATYISGIASTGPSGKKNNAATATSITTAAIKTTIVNEGMKKQLQIRIFKF